MGLDGVELVMEVEEAFDISITEEEAIKMETPGDMFDYLAGTVFKAMPVGPCLSRSVFNRMRRAIVAEFGIDRSSVKPRAVIAKATPQFLVRGRRKSLLKRLDFRKSSPILANLNWFRREYGTFGELAHDILSRNYGTLAEEAGMWNPKEAWECLRRIISWQLGVKIEKVTRAARFYDDLGLN